VKPKTYGAGPATTTKHLVAGHHDRESLDLS